MDITGRKLFVKALQEEGVDTIFGYPGGMVTDLFDELYKQDGIEVVLPRHEQGLLHEAEGYAKATGKVGVCLVTSGPGATNIITGLADAHYDNIPLVCFTGQVPLNLIGNDAFQEVDIVGMTRSVTKYGVTVRDRKDLGRIIKMAFHIATTGNPGPVLIDIPKDIQVASGPAVYPDKVEIRGYKPSTGVHIGQLKKGYKLLKAAKKPLFLIGGGVNAAKANKELLELVECTKIPVVTTVMGKGAIPTDHPYYIGNSGMHGRYAANLAVSECDVLFSIGTRFNDRITGDSERVCTKCKDCTCRYRYSIHFQKCCGGCTNCSRCKTCDPKTVRVGRAAKDGEMESLHCTVGRRKSVTDAKRPWTDPTDDHGRHQSGI